MKNRNKKLKNRVQESRKSLERLSVKKARYSFVLKYPKYSGEDKEDRLNNLWYCKAFDEDFTTELECFVNFKKSEK